MKKHRWRWRQFGLRTLFGLTALFAVWCNSQVQIVRERQTLQSRLQHKGFGFSVAQDGSSVSFVRRLIGD